VERQKNTQTRKVLLQRRMQAKMAEFAPQIQYVKNSFLQKRRDFDNQKLNKVLPSRFGQAPQGTAYIQGYASRGGEATQVANCLADVVDATENVLTGVSPTLCFTETFQAPQIPEMERFFHDDKVLAQELGIVTQQLQNAEAQRDGAYRRLMKAKQEYEYGPGVGDTTRFIKAPPLGTGMPLPSASLSLSALKGKTNAPYGAMYK